MNVLIVGRGQGSYTMRGLQIGAALGARVTSDPTEADWQWAETVILVKRDGVKWAARARARQMPVVWDALDCWQQPLQNGLDEASALGGVCIPHHGRFGLVPTPAREQMRVVGYDGSPAFLAEWAPAIERACAARGWMFVINPPDLSAVDVLVALRGGPWDGWMCREWKSGVKLANAILAGRPMLMQDTAAARELQPAGTIVYGVGDIPAALDAWRDYDRRAAVVEVSCARATEFTVEAAAARYVLILSTLTEARSC